MMYHLALVDTCSLFPGITKDLLPDVFKQPWWPLGGPVLLWQHMFGPGAQGPPSPDGQQSDERRLSAVLENCEAVEAAKGRGTSRSTSRSRSGGKGQQQQQQQAKTTNALMDALWGPPPVAKLQNFVRKAKSSRGSSRHDGRDGKL